MKGTDVTPEQMESANQFVLGCWCENRGPGEPKQIAPEQTISLPFGDLVRLVAWYAAIRYEAGEKGIGTRDIPGGYLERKSS